MVGGWLFRVGVFGFGLAVRVVRRLEIAVGDRIRVRVEDCIYLSRALALLVKLRYTSKLNLL